MKAPLFLALALGLITAVPLSAQEGQRPPLIPLRAAIVREGMLLAQSSPNPPAPRARPRPWRASHPVAFGVIVGSLSGAVAGWVFLATNCHKSEAVCSPVGATLWTGMFTGIGAESGAVVGAIVGR